MPKTRMAVPKLDGLLGDSSSVRTFFRHWKSLSLNWFLDTVKFRCSRGSGVQRSLSDSPETA